MRIYQHIKRGTLYRIIHGTAIWEHTMTPSVVYQEVGGNGHVWVRPAEEFFDPTRFRECSENIELDFKILTDERDGEENIA